VRTGALLLLYGVFLGACYLLLADYLRPGGCADCARKKNGTWEAVTVIDIPTPTVRTPEPAA
jgi:hypothetical protein